ncbi:LysR family transcriptional regulator [Pseudonocardia alaniniphila]|uniref:LysR family transcriptional regulator n=1 Tax=Pseudonocardia alaniniphila TaxID=75291 RepID=A0ABS9TH01_9PSEU|nr:LysR family transcriptional regulator [Pseudonocardia alaniniphila]MCH6167792.1 LysR family transcriptional regulator [Pseudonocardia alaniniphila]
MLLDASRLHVLVEVAHAGSIAAAATRMGFTPSALSQQLTKLEREVGAPLVDRGRAGTTLTGLGRVLLEHGERVVGELRDAERAIQSAIIDQPQQIAVGAFSSAARTVLPQALAVLRKRRPGVKFSLVDVEPPDGYGLVVARELDLLITHHYPGAVLPAATGLRRQLLFRDALRLVLPRGHRFAGSAEVAIAELQDEDWISGAPGVPHRTFLESLGSVHVAYETVDYEVTLALIAAGLGISLVPASMLGRHDAVIVRDLSESAPTREIYIVHGCRPSPLVAELIAQLRATRTQPA